jgi:hypothetical protein
MKITSQTVTGAAAILTAVGFNTFFTILGTTFEYPDILRQPAADVLAAFAKGGNSLILTWYGFALTALVLIPLSLVLAFGQRQATPLTTSAAIFGTLAGLTQAIGLFRWTFVVPMLAANPGPQSDAAFALMNQFGGVEIGEHLGQLLTAGFLVAMAMIHRSEGAVYRPALAVLTAVTIVVGAGEGILLALNLSTGITPLAGIIGYLGLSAWLILTGVTLIWRPIR